MGGEDGGGEVPTIPGGGVDGGNGTSVNGTMGGINGTETMSDEEKCKHAVLKFLCSETAKKVTGGSHLRSESTGVGSNIVNDIEDLIPGVSASLVNGVDPKKTDWSLW